MKIEGIGNGTLMIESPPSFLTDSLNSAISFLVHMDAGVTKLKNEYRSYQNVHQNTQNFFLILV
jgi:hypothetical protein